MSFLCALCHAESDSGIFTGVSGGCALSAALQLSKRVKDAVIVVLLPDWGDRYLSTGVFGKDSAKLVIDHVASPPPAKSQ